MMKRSSKENRKADRCKWTLVSRFMEETVCKLRELSVANELAFHKFVMNTHNQEENSQADYEQDELDAINQIFDFPDQSEVALIKLVVRLRVSVPSMQVMTPECIFAHQNPLDVVNNYQDDVVIELGQTLYEGLSERVNACISELFAEFCIRENQNIDKLIHRMKNSLDCFEDDKQKLVSCIVKAIQERSVRDFETLVIACRGRHHQTVCYTLDIGLCVYISSWIDEFMEIVDSAVDNRMNVWFD